MIPTLSPQLAPAVFKGMADCPAYRISDGDTNYFALVFDTREEGCDLVAVVEIFEPGGATPPNTHQHAHEMFFVLQGEGEVILNGGFPKSLGQGDALLVRPGTSHLVRNTGSRKLYCLTVMVPDEAFGDLIRNGSSVVLDAEDRRVLTGAA